MSSLMQSVPGGQVLLQPIATAVMYVVLEPTIWALFISWSAQLRAGENLARESTPGAVVELH